MAQLEIRMMSRGSGIIKPPPPEDGQTSPVSPETEGDKAKRRVSFAVDAREHSRDAPLRLETVQDIASELFQGSLLIKIRGKKAYERYFYIDPETRALTWFSSKKSGTRSIPLKDIVRVTPGKSSAFDIPDAEGYAPGKCLSVWHKPHKQMALIATSEDERDLWVTGLRQLARTKSSVADKPSPRMTWAMHLFDKTADRADLDMTQCKQLLGEMLPHVNAPAIDTAVHNLFERLAWSKLYQHERAGTLADFLKPSEDTNANDTNAASSVGADADAKPADADADANANADAEAASPAAASGSAGGADADEDTSDAQKDAGAENADQAGDAPQPEAPKAPQTFADDEGSGEYDFAGVTGGAAPNTFADDEGSGEYDFAGVSAPAPPPTMPTDVEPIMERMRCPFDEFYHVFKRLGTRRELYFILHKYADADGKLSAERLLMLLEIEQQVLGLTIDDAKALITQHEPIPELRDQGHLGLDGLTRLLREQHRLPVAHGSVDTSQSLTQYYVSAAHNSYLEAGQVKGQCSAASVVRCLQAGARSIEIDIWPETEEGGAVIKHGHTAVKPAPVREVLEAIKEHAFATSTLPLLLFVELHLQDDEQKKTAELVSELLGDLLFVPSSEMRRRVNKLPTLDALCNKILIVSSKLSPTEEDSGEPHEMIEVDEFAFYADIKKKRKNKQGRKETKKVPRIKIYPEWSKLVALAHEAIKDPSDAMRDINVWTVKSISEQVVVKLFETGNAESLVRLCQRQLVRCYPGGSRVDSDNMDASLAWAAGCHVAAMNFQTHDLGFQKQLGLFPRADVGYVRRPAFLSDSHVEFSPSWTAAEVIARPAHAVAAPRTYVVVVVSAQQLRTSPGLSAAGELERAAVVDPYVHIQVSGLPRDQSAYTTRALDNNNIDPYWHETARFAVTCPPTAMIEFLVLDDDIVRDNFLGAAALPMEQLARGYQHIQLVDKGGTAIPNCSLFVHIEIEDILESDVQQSSDATIKPSRASKDKRSRRSSVSLNLDFEPPELAMSGIAELDVAFGNCNKLLIDLASLRAEYEAQKHDLAHAAGIKADVTYAEIVEALATKLSDVPHRVLPRDNDAIELELPEDEEIPADARRASEVLASECRRASKFVQETSTLQQAMTDMALTFDTMEDQLEQTLEGHASKAALCNSNIEEFRKIQQQVRQLATVAQEARHSLVYHLTTTRRARLLSWQH